MPYLYLITAVICSSSVSIASGFFTRKTAGKKGGNAFFLCVELGVIFLLWAIAYALNFSFEPSVLIYSVLFGVFFVMATTGNINAISHGSVALTSLVNQSSMLLVSVWGLLLWGETFTLETGVGLVLVLVALWLCLNPTSGGTKINVKWLVFATMLLVGNAGASIVQRNQQMAFGGMHGNMLMFFAVMIATGFCLIRFLRSDRTDAGAMLRGGVVWPMIAGVANMLMNVVVMLLATTTLPASLIYPTISIGGLMLSVLFSRFVFKEHLSPMQWVGIGLGVIATAILA